MRQPLSRSAAAHWTSHARRSNVRAVQTEAALTEATVALAAEYGRYGYRLVIALLQAEGWRVNAKRVGASGGARS